MCCIFNRGSFSQAECRGFDSRLPLHRIKHLGPRSDFRSPVIGAARIASSSQALLPKELVLAWITADHAGTQSETACTDCSESLFSANFRMARATRIESNDWFGEIPGLSEKYLLHPVPRRLVATTHQRSRCGRPSYESFGAHAEPGPLSGSRSTSGSHDPPQRARPGT